MSYRVAHSERPLLPGRLRARRQGPEVVAEIEGVWPKIPKKDTDDIAIDTEI